jgi:small basic protein (TIGR04137 family)
MTIDKTLKVKRGSTGSRSVLTRVERVEKLKEQERWTETSTALGMPKVRVRKLTMKKKKKTKEEEAATGKDAKAPAAKGKK